MAVLNNTNRPCGDLSDTVTRKVLQGHFTNHGQSAGKEMANLLTERRGGWIVQSASWCLPRSLSQSLIQCVRHSGSGNMGREWL